MFPKEKSNMLYQILLIDQIRLITALGNWEFIGDQKKLFWDVLWFLLLSWVYFIIYNIFLIHYWWSISSIWPPYWILLLFPILYQLTYLYFLGRKIILFENIDRSVSLFNIYTSFGINWDLQCSLKQKWKWPLL